MKFVKPGRFAIPMLIYIFVMKIFFLQIFFLPRFFICGLKKGMYIYYAGSAGIAKGLVQKAIQLGKNMKNHVKGGAAIFRALLSNFNKAFYNHASSKK